MLISFLRILREPRFTLFPYTTLFRSGVTLETVAELLSVADGAIVGTAVKQGGDVRNPVDRDRKSTRLNSSHRCISYAVFCLKKKRNDLELKERHASTIEDGQLYSVPN